MDEGDTVTFASGAAYGALLVGRYGYGAVTGADRSDRAGSACSEEEGARDHPWAPYVAEFVGTFILVFTFGCVALSTVHVPWKPTAWACTVTVMIYSTAPVSGGFLNPAVSMALSLLGVIPGHRCLGFCLTQFIAALCASALLKGLCGVGGSAFRSAMEVDDPPLPGSLLMFLELLYTAVLCFAASCCLVLKRNNPKEKSQSFGLAIGLLYVAGGHALHLERGATMNPAITLAVATVAPGGWHWALPWALAEFLGALLGTYLFAVLRANAEDFCQEEFLELCAPRRSARLLGELIGTFTYVLTFGLNAVSLSEATAWSCAGALISMIYAVGKISGGHFNPAVTLAVVLSGRSVCSVADGLAYAAVQVCGGLATGLLVAVYHMNGPYFFLSFTPLPAKAWRDYSVVQVGLAEGVFTFVLAYVALACSTVAMPKAHKRQNLFFGLAEGFCVMTGGCAVGTFSGGMLNPAVAVGVWMLNVAEIHSIQEAGNGLCTLLKFSTFQCTGGLLAAVVFRITHPSEYCKAPLLVR